ncbi:MAG: cell division protein SepF [Candidatus Aenigmarchaeota archaeon]|nr:cell division protein SepF [Candidatus Aenigmarchaeota archaeon]
MVFKIFKKKVEKPEYVEIESLPERVRISVKVDVLNELKDVSRLQQLIRNGNIVFTRIKELRKKDINELKRAVDRIKRTCTAVGGDLVGVDEDYLVITPSNVKIVK